MSVKFINYNYLVHKNERRKPTTRSLYVVYIFSLKKRKRFCILHIEELRLVEDSSITHAHTVAATSSDAVSPLDVAGATGTSRTIFPPFKKLLISSPLSVSNCINAFAKLSWSF